MKIRAESVSDKKAVYEINKQAFPGDDEAKLVDALRENADPIVSLVAELKGQVIGHILFSPVTLSSRPDLKLMGLAPMAVLPEFQKQGIGSKLVNESVSKCKDLEFAGIVVLGHPDYYPKFGFVPSVNFGIKCTYDVPDEAFMVLELKEGVFKAGVVSYHPEFDNL
ncbi:MAG: N-acetyltransferase [Candidatus Cloacimonetes bacterium]|nr:N-acetyltransferase [Candidatus Cloacimonadota bacterium]